MKRLRTLVPFVGLQPRVTPPEHEFDADDEPSFKLLRAAFEQYEAGGWTFDAHVQTDAARFLAFCSLAVLGDAENYQTGGMLLRTTDGEQRFELTVRRVEGKTPQERIAELEAELAAAKAA